MSGTEVLRSWMALNESMTMSLGESVLRISLSRGTSGGDAVLLQLLPDGLVEDGARGELLLVVEAELLQVAHDLRQRLGERGEVEDRARLASWALAKISRSARIVLPLPGSPMTMLIELEGKPPPRMASNWLLPVRTRGRLSRPEEGGGEPGGCVSVMSVSRQGHERGSRGAPAPS